MKIARFLPKSLVGQSLAVIALALLVLQLATGILFWREWQGYQRDQAWSRLAGLSAQYAEDLDALAQPARPDWLYSRSDRNMRLMLAPDPAARHQPFYDNMLLLFPGDRDIRIMSLKRRDKKKHHRHEDDHDDDHDDIDHFDRDERAHSAWRRPLRGPEHVLLSIRLQDGHWLNIRAFLYPWRQVDGFGPVIRFALLAIVVLGLIWISLRRVNKPLDELTQAADSFGKGGQVTPLDETGPTEIRKAATAFNHMQANLKRHMDDRRVMFGAMSHDLRTPLTRLRLRAEMVENAEDREAMIRDLEAMDMLVNDSLAFAKDDYNQESMEEQDLVLLIQQAIADIDIEGIAYSGPRSHMTRYRPHALRRVLDNLLANAINWGAMPVTVMLEIQDHAVVLSVSDAGPGIGDALPEDLFQPFARGESSRNRDTGGTGLGLAICRSIIRAHGGEMTITNIAEGGTKVTAVMPG